MNPIEALSETSKSIFSRTTNPLIGTFLTSWLIINWQVVLLIFKSELAIEDLILAIQEDHLIISKMVWYPLFFSTGYVLLMPWINVLITKINSAAEVIRARIINRKMIDLNEMQLTTKLSNSNIRFPYESIEKILASALMNMTDLEKRQIITSLRALLPDQKAQGQFFQSNWEI